MDQMLRSRVLLWLQLIGVLIVAGTIGYVVIEGWEVQDGFYMTVITLSTVGYGETQDLTGLGRMFTSLLIFASMVSVACFAACMTSVVVSGDLTGLHLQRKARQMAKRLRNHTIVCGSGLLASTVIDQLVRAGEPVVALSDDPEHVAAMRQMFPQISVVEGDPCSEIALADANVLRAQNVVAALDRDVDNLLIGMTCKDLGTSVKVFARSDSTDLASRMLKMGVDQVISPFQLSGEHVASMIGIAVAV